jgi:N-acetylneuraminate synthase
VVSAGDGYAGDVDAGIRKAWPLVITAPRENRARFIAELGSNHNRDAQRARRLIDECAAAGASAVKIQVFRIEDLFAPEVLAARADLRARRAWEFPLDLLKPLVAHARHRGLQFGATPFGLWAVEELAPHCDFLKVASYELLWHDLIAACGRTGLPLILSTGMATTSEVEAAVTAARDAGCRDLTLLHCVSAYPTPRDQCNLAAIATLAELCSCPVGWSDHSTDARVVERAVSRWGASAIELHVDLEDAEGSEAGGHNWTPRSLAPMIDAPASAAVAVRDPADGDGVKRPMPAEEHDVPWRADASDGLRPLRSTRAGI